MTSYERGLNEQPRAIVIDNVIISFFRERQGKEHYFKCIGHVSTYLEGGLYIRTR